ncbi:MAG: CIA30 family protein, partial [Rubripirellula sp.]
MIRLTSTIFALMYLPLSAATVGAQGSVAASDVSEVKTLFNLKDSNAASQWQIVNDGVMGGRSSSRVDRAGEGLLRFSGNLSLANNGGFASMRSRPRAI